MIENNFLKFSMLRTILRELTFIESQLLFPSIDRTNCGDMPLPRALIICKARFLPPIAVHNELLPKFPAVIAASGSSEGEMFSSGAFWF